MLKQLLQTKKFFIIKTLFSFFLFAISFLLFKLISSIVPVLILSHLLGCFFSLVFLYFTNNLLMYVIDFMQIYYLFDSNQGLYNFDNLYEIRSLNEIQFIFENEYLIDAVLSLIKKQQVLIYYKYFEDLTDKEIAKKMHTTRQAVTSLKHYTLHKLRESLENTKQM